MEVLNMLNAKYFIVRGQEGPPVAQTNPGALGNAWFVNELRVVENADSEITALSNFNPALEAIVDKKYESEISQLASLQYDSSATISMTEYNANHLVYQSNSSLQQLAVFSEIYYEDGWNAYVDGVLTPHFGVNYVLRAMIIPPGEHKIDFKFEPATYFMGEKISLAFSSLLLLLCAGIGYREIRTEKIESD
jgi:uncharacterized membrane protein YfhO